MHDVLDMGCSGCGLFETWNVRDVAYWFTKCCILKYDFLAKNRPIHFHINSIKFIRPIKKKI